MDAASMIGLFGNGKVKRTYVYPFYENSVGGYSGFGRTVSEILSNQYYSVSSFYSSYSNSTIYTGPLSYTIPLTGFTNINKMIPIIFVGDSLGDSSYNRISSFNQSSITIQAGCLFGSSDKASSTADTSYTVVYTLNFLLYVIEYE